MQRLGRRSRTGALRLLGGQNRACARSRRRRRARDHRVRQPRRRAGQRSRFWPIAATAPFAAERLLTRGFGEELQDVGDLNHDGVPDLLFSNYLANGIAIYLGNGALALRCRHSLRNRDARRSVADHRLRPRWNAGRHQPFLRFRQSGSRASLSWPRRRRAGTEDDVRHAAGERRLALVAHDQRRARDPRQRTFWELGILRFANGAVSVSTVAAGPGFDLSSTFADVNGDGIADIIDTDLYESAQEPIFVTLAQCRRKFRDTKAARTRAKVSFPVQVRVSRPRRRRPSPTSSSAISSHRPLLLSRQRRGRFRGRRRHRRRRPGQRVRHRRREWRRLSRPRDRERRPHRLGHREPRPMSSSRRRAAKH